MTQMTPSKVKWLLFFFIHEIMDFYQICIDLVTEIKSYSGAAEEDIKIFILLDKVSKNEEGKYVFEPELKELYMDSHAPNNYSERNPLPDIIMDDPDKYNKWKRIFEYVYMTFPSERKILFTWSHGKGFGINADFNAAAPHDCKKELIVKSNDILFISKEYIENGSNISFEQLSSGNNINQFTPFIPTARENVVSCNKLNIIWVQELADVLKKSLPVGEKIDFLLMVNCNMQTVDNNIILSEKVKYLVAPESLFPYYGYNYHGLLRLIRNHLDIPDELIPKTIVRDFVRKFVFDLPLQNDLLNNYTVFVNRLGYADMFLFIINKLANTLIELIDNPEMVRLINQIRVQNIQVTTGMEEIQLVDLGLLLKLLSEKIPEHDEFSMYHQYYKNLISMVVKAKFVGDNFTIADKYREQKFCQSGVSIFFPSTVELFENSTLALCSYYNRITRSKFAELSRWDDFLKIYFSRLKQF